MLFAVINLDTIYGYGLSYNKYLKVQSTLSILVNMVMIYGFLNL